MNQTSISKTEGGFIGSDFILALASLGILMAFAVIFVGKRDFDDRKNCQTLAEAVKDLSATRGDRFVMDAIKLHAFSKTDQPMSFWLKRIVGESNLIEAEDYIVTDNDGQKRPLLTIDAARGIFAKAVEDHDGFFQGPKTRNARKILECLQHPYFSTFSEAGQ